MNSIFRLPNELTFAIVQQLSIVDAFGLSQTCWRFQNLFCDNSICRSLLESQAAFSSEFLEAKETQQYARAFRLLAKRRLAISNLEPFATAIIAVADSHLYVNGTLLYIIERKLFILPLRGNARSEYVVHIRKLLDRAVDESRDTTKYKFILLHYADGIVTCRYTHCRTTNETWLVVFSIREHWTRSVRVPLPTRLFARSNKDYVIFGTYTGQGDDGHRRWVLRRYSIREERLVGTSRYLDRVLGSDIGVNVYFDIIGDCFYALSNQTSLELMVGITDSYYYCCRFPLSDMDAITEATSDSLWRRLNAEGTIDERWSFIRMVADEETGRLTILESRKEWRFGSSDSRRTYYTQEVVFPTKDDAVLSCRTGGRIGAALDVFYHDASSSSRPDGWRRQNDFPDMADVDRKQHIPRRSPENVHPGDDSSKMMPFTPSTCLVRAYFPTCSTFLDLVNLPAETDPAARRLRLRAGSRKPRSACPMLPSPDSPRDEAGEDEEQLYPLREIEQQFATIEPTTWPPAVQGQQASRNLVLDRIMNPNGHQGEVSGTWDDRSLLYSIEGDDKMHALVFISFDASVRLPHLRPWHDRPDRAVTRSAAVSVSSSPDYRQYIDLSDDDPTPEGLQPDWLSSNNVPLYKDIDMGYHFFY
ncbi:f-box domain containing protein [Grosmannia clavigera kw1407]|uniref:F-box domain containing protein n=1 Tax=Grosmannia clavigera (strain kw1407 / UAMH 11150) TaxID=655863 RepID=F0XSS2_GROCL|nr:f-box domain containing protein [Grosmannia clavigera kw1407]EFW99263.1 f-box domain containing protein [Grosmannia clavigera kw1407]